MNPSSANAYESTPVDYLREISRLFGDYKERAFTFMELKEGEGLLDAGCGTGDDLLTIASVMKDTVKLYGVDLDPETLKAASTRALDRGARIDFRKGDLTQLPFAKDSVDVVRSDRVFQHLTQPEAVLKEMIRVTRPGGRLIAMDVDWGTLVLDHPMTELTDRLCAFARDHHTNGRSGRQLRNWFIQAGLHDVNGYADAVCVDDWNIATYIWGLRALLDQFVAAGGADPAEAQSWWALGSENGSEGLFCGSMTGFVMRGFVN